MKPPLNPLEPDVDPSDAEFHKRNARWHRWLEGYVGREVVRKIKLRILLWDIAWAVLAAVAICFLAVLAMIS